MRRAIALSAFGLGTTSPNPPVGCVILDPDGRIIGEGFHERKGDPHAEAHALAAAGKRAKGATAVVTLEPCNHVGRTPACRQLLIDAGVARVVVAVVDPTSRGEGGAAVLRDAGVDVETGVLADEARLVLGTWLTALDLKRPVMTWAYTLRVNGIGALDDEMTRDLRSQADAVLSEDGTVAEGVPGSHGQGTLRLPTETRPGYPHAALGALYAGGVRSLLLLGGQVLAEPFLSAGLIDRVTVYLERRDEPSSGPALPWALAPHGFRIVSATRSREYVRIECVASQ
jgi:diaminohydroxyphosphoribosylaminopyrimidine deaminase/5-amino-6-(5-phosphoribosylamino)uracil reductase